MLDLDHITVQDIRQGYRLTGCPRQYSCLFCTAVFDEGQIYEQDGKLYTADRAISLHIQKTHQSVFEQLLKLDKRFIGLTDNQKKVLRLMYQGYDTRRIAEETGTAASTIRAQRFLFKEKSRQAKLTLALFQTLEDALQSAPAKETDAETADSLSPIHATAAQIDERFAITAADKEKVIRTYVVSRDPLVIKGLPVKEKRKLVLLQLIAACFTPGQLYTEKEINAIIQPIYADFVTIRRYLIEYGYLDRTPSGSSYWIKSAGE